MQIQVDSTLPAILGVEQRGCPRLENGVRLEANWSKEHQLQSAHPGAEEFAAHCFMAGLLMEFAILGLFVCGKPTRPALQLWHDLPSWLSTSSFTRDALFYGRSDSGAVSYGAQSHSYRFRANKFAASPSSRAQLEDSENALVLQTVSKAEEPLCGMPDDVQPHLPTDKQGKVNWDTFVPPSKGESYVDPVFGCTVRRLTEDSFSYHDYSTTEALSANESYVLVGDNGAMRVVDLRGNVVVDEAHMPAHNNGHFIWDSRIGNRFYYALDNRLRSGTIRARNSVATATVYVFREYPHWITIMDYANVSTDGDHIALVGENPSARGVATIDFFAFQLSTKAKSYRFTSSELGCVVKRAPAELGGQPGGDCMHKLLLTADNRPAMEWHPNGDPRMPTGCVAAFAAGASCKTITNADGSLKMLQSGTTHMDAGWDITGKESIIIQDFDPDPNGTHQNDPCYNQGGISVKNVNTLVLTCLLSMNFRAGHVSYFGGPNQPWVAVDVEDGRNPGPEWYNTHSESYTAPTQPCLQQGATIAPHCWTLYQSEILLVRVDNVGNPSGLGGAKGKTFRLAHTRSRHEESYYAQPRASLSRDGRFIVFDSNMAHPDGKCGGRSTNGCADVYLLGPLF